MATFNNPVLVLLSGGLDSSVLLHYVAQRTQHGAVHTLSFNYGQRHDRELECARWQASSAGAAHHTVLDISFLAGLVGNATALVRGGREVPDLAELAPEQRAQPPTYVPNRNMILIAMAAAHAESAKIHNLFYGAQAQDEYGYWDCTKPFLDGINAVLSLNRAAPVRVHAPLIANSKADNVRLGLELGVDFAQTWSCYRGGELACGTCPTCVERLNAFKACGRRDPLPYMRLDS